MNFEKMWNSYYPRLTVYLRKSFRLSREDTEDIVQETLLKIFKNRTGYDETYAFSTWVYTVGRNTCIDFLRKTRRFSENEEILDEADALTDHRQQGPEAALVRGEELREIAAAVDRLTASNRELVYLRMYEDCTYREISTITGKPVGTVKYRFSEIRKQLKKELGDEYGKKTGFYAFRRVEN